MYYSVSYDIQLNKTRLLAVKQCKLAGLMRLQRSVFIGPSSPQRIKELEEVLIPRLQQHTDSLSIQPLDAIAFRRLKLIGLHPRKQELARNQWIVFF